MRLSDPLPIPSRYSENIVLFDDFESAQEYWFDTNSFYVDNESVNVAEPVFWNVDIDDEPQFAVVISTSRPGPWEVE